MNRKAFSKLKCPICNSAKGNIFKHGVYDSKKTDVIECKNCEIQYLYSQMSLKEEKKLL